jgi:hypothetical protein
MERINAIIKKFWWADVQEDNPTSPIASGLGMIFAKARITVGLASETFILLTGASSPMLLMILLIIKTLYLLLFLRPNNFLTTLSRLLIMLDPGPFFGFLLCSLKRICAPML